MNLLNFMKNIFLLFGLVAYQFSFAQNAWSFEDCVNFALNNNINVNQTKLNTEYAKNTVLQNKLGMYTPSVSASVTEGINFANSVNPLTYSFVQQNTNSTQLGLYLDYSLFEGLSRWNQTLASEKELDATQYEQQVLENNTRILVANYYLNALMAYESLKIAQEKQNLSVAQLKNTKELVKSGVLAYGDQVEVEAQNANDELNTVNAQNALDKAINQLKILLQLNPNTDFSIATLNVKNQPTANYNFNSINEQAIKMLPNVKAAELRVHAAELKLKAAKGSLSPTISFSAFLGTNYFSATQEQTGTSSSLIPIGYVDGTNQVVFTNYATPTYGNKAFGKQLSDNFNQNIRFSLNIPIFGKWQRMIAIDNAKLNILSASYDIENSKNQLQQDVFTAYTNYTMTGKKLDANEKNMTAATTAFNYANEKYSVGIINAFEFETAKNRFITAQTNLVQAQYEHFFRKLILDFYNTGTLSF